MNESNTFTSLFKKVEEDLFERGNEYRNKKPSKATLKEIRICTPDHFKYEFKKIKNEREKISNEEKKKYKIESENLKNRLKNCHNYYDQYQCFIKQNNNLKKIKLNLINKMTDEIFHTKPTIEEKAEFNQLDNSLTQYIHDFNIIENKEIDEEKHLEFIKGLSKTFDQSIKKITKNDIKRIYETGTVVSMAKKRSKFFNEDKIDKIVNSSILEAVNRMNKELRRLNEKDGLALPDNIAKQREIMLTNSVYHTEKSKEKSNNRSKRLSIFERRKSQDLSISIEINEALLKNNNKRRISFTQIKKSYDEVNQYVNEENRYGNSMLNKMRRNLYSRCIFEQPFSSIVDDFGHTSAFYQSKRSILNVLYPDEKSIITKNKNLRNTKDNTFIFQLIRSHPAFKKYSTYILKEICKIISFKILKKNQIVYNKGDSVKSWYIILEGVVGFYGVKNNKMIPLITYGENEDFCKISLYSESPQNYTVKVLSDKGLFACLEKDSFIHIIQWMSKYDLMANHKFFKSFSELSNIYDSIIEIMSNICCTLHYSAGSTIIKENDIIKCVYFIQSGTCEVNTSIEIDINQEMKHIIEKYSGYGSKYDMPKFTDPYDRRIITQSIEDVISQDEIMNEDSDYNSSLSSSTNLLLNKNKEKETSNDYLDSLIPPDIRVKQIKLGELYKNQHFGEGAAIAIENFEKYKSPVTVKCITDVTILAISIFDLVKLLPRFFTENEYFCMTKKDSLNIYYKQKEEDYWVKIKERVLTTILKEQSGDCLKKYSVERIK
ncbi:hypothetical protein BCR36DRAFT_291163 [Piromyces finnis]|uniref:Cyclic nucleotide-binding domain-containing protein n=1 Tax=Piromyces finnis TaxID=1754191 RepID=A0A1Y1V8N0_9FUNG|nr:hypothetical protein BCR36DRAFT_291163 [Piromyces finnis]|eukprot:ORX49702.1 hypothetical protein BCR36DRAFT_291163 [Piromyces finnis]